MSFIEKRPKVPGQSLRFRQEIFIWKSLQSYPTSSLECLQDTIGDISLPGSLIRELHPIDDVSYPPGEDRSEHTIYFRFLKRISLARLPIGATLSNLGPYLIPRVIGPLNRIPPVNTPVIAPNFPSMKAAHFSSFAVKLGILSL